MEGEKWEAADKAATELIGRLTDKDFFNVEIFHDQSKWFNSGRPNRPRCRTSSEPANSLTVIRLQAVQNLESRWSRLYLCRERRALRLDISFSLPMARYRISLGYYDWPMKKESYRTGGLFMSYRSTCHRTHCWRDNWHLVQEERLSLPIILFVLMQIRWRLPFLWEDCLFAALYGSVVWWLASTV